MMKIIKLMPRIFTLVVFLGCIAVGTLPAYASFYGSGIYGAGVYSPTDTEGPTSVITQGAGQNDPTNVSPVNFTVTFNETVTDFATGDVTLTGTAGATTATVTGSGTVYNVAVTGMATSGTVSISIPVDVCHDAVGNPNSVSVNTDNTVTWDVTGPVISSVTITPTATTAKFVWTTNEPATSKVEYGLFDVYGSDESDVTLVQTHELTLSDLLPCVSYYYIIKSEDALGNESTNNAGTSFTTTCTGSAAVESQTANNVALTGGSLNLLAGGLGLNLTVPNGYAATQALFQAKKIGKTATLIVTSLPTGYIAAGDYIYDLEALTGVSAKLTTFLAALTVKITYTDTDIAGIDENSLKIFRWDGSTWAILTGCVVDPTANTVTCTTDTFSMFGLFGVESVDDETNEGCTKDAPHGKTQINSISSDTTFLKVKFSGAEDPYSKFEIKWGTDSSLAKVYLGSKAFGNRHTNEYTIKNLTPNTTYYIKVRAINGCKGGTWSKTIAAKTTSATKTDMAASLRTDIINFEYTPKDTTTSPPSNDSDSIGNTAYELKVKVVDNKRKPVEGAKVTLHSTPREGITDRDGVVAFANVDAGSHEVAVEYGGQSGKQTINLEGNQIKEFSITIQIQSKNPFMNGPVIVVMSLMGLVIAGMLFKNRGRITNSNYSGSSKVMLIKKAK
jgi:hypothetical protein